MVGIGIVDPGGDVVEWNLDAVDQPIVAVLDVHGRQSDVGIVEAHLAYKQSRCLVKVQLDGVVSAYRFLFPITTTGLSSMVIAGKPARQLVNSP